jgi:uncharacterized protein YkwD
LSERLGRFRDLLRVLRPGLRNRGGRLALGALVSTVLTALVLSVPVVSGAAGGTPYVAADSFAATSAARTTDGDSPVVMGRDGRPVTSSASAGGTTSSAAPGRSTTDASAGRASTAPASTEPLTTDAAPAAPAPAETPAASAPVPAPEPAPAPAAAEAPAPAAAAAPTAEPADLSVEGQVLALVNVQRAAAGCGAVTADPALAALARAHSADMRDRDFFDHVNPDRLDPFERGSRAGVVVRAENIAEGQPDPAAVMDAWMHSAGHRANILNCDLTRLGVGVAEGTGGRWWTQDFA